MGGDDMRPMRDEDHDDMDMDMDRDMKMVGMAGSFGFLAVAIGTAQQAALDLFRYKPADTYYALGDASESILTRNYWKTANLIAQWGGFTFASFLALLQIASMFGYGVELNVGLWLAHITMINPTVVGTVLVLKKIAYDQAWDECVNGGTANACTLQSTLELEMLKDFATQTAIYLTFLVSIESWMRGQFMALSPEQKEDWMGEHMEMEMGGRGREHDDDSDSDSDDDDESDDDESDGEGPDGAVDRMDRQELFRLFGL